jgi:hypothetical protein
MASLVLNGATSGSITISSPSVAGSNTLSLPASTGTVVVTSGAQTIEFADGSASTPSITNSGDTNTGMFFPAADTIAFAEGGAEAMRLDSSGNVGIGTTSPVNLTGQKSVTINSSGVARTDYQISGTTQGFVLVESGYLGIYTPSTQYLSLGTNDTERMRITSAGLLQFNSGYGSVATAYGCRAWVKFNGTGTPAINGSGNVTSITDNGTGDYTINFTTALVDTNYSVVLGNNYSGTVAFCAINPNSPIYSTTQVKIQVVDRNGSAQDTSILNAAILR